MSERRKFHPLAIIGYWIQALKSWLLFLVLTAFDGESLHIPLIIVSLTFAQALAKYLTRTYTISPEKIILFHGVFRKKETDIPYERIQTIKQRQWFFFKPFNLIQLLIETAGGNKQQAEGELPAVDIRTLELLESYRHRTPVEKETPLEPDALYHVTDEQIFLFGITDLSILASLTALLAFAAELIPDSWYTTAVSTAEDFYRRGWIFLVGLLLVVVILLLLVSLAKNFFQFYNFKVSRSNQTLTIASGLLERKVQKIPVDKIQGIRIRQQVLRKLLKLSSVEIMLAGGQEQQGEQNVPTKLYVLPIIADNILYPTLGSLLPEWQLEKPAIVPASVPKWWYFWRWHLLLVPVIAAGFYFNRYLGVAVVGLAAFYLFCAWLDYRHQGYAIQTGSRLCLQSYESLTRVQTFVERPKIQTLSSSTSKWLYPKQIGHICITLKTGLGSETLKLKFITREHQQRLQSFYLK